MMYDQRIDQAPPSEAPEATGQGVSKMSKALKIGRIKTGRFNLSIGQKMISVVVLIIGLLAVVAGTGIYQMKNIGSEIEEIAEQDMPLTEAITAITIHQLEQAINFERALRYGAELETHEESRGHFDAAFAKFEELTHQVDKEIVDAEELAKGAIEHAQTAEAKKSSSTSWRPWRRSKTSTPTTRSTSSTWSS